MSDGRAVDGLGAGPEKGVGGAAKGGSGGTDVVNEKGAVARHSMSCREAPPRKLHPCDPGSSGLSTPAVAPKGGNEFSIEGPRHLRPEKARGTESPAQTVKAARWNRRHDRYLIEPGGEPDPRRQPAAEGACDLVMPPVLERQDCPPKGTVVDAPKDGARLRRRGGDAAEAGFGLGIGRDATERTARFGHGVKPTPALRAETPVVAREHAVARHAERGQKNLRYCAHQGSHADSHGPEAHPSPVRNDALSRSWRQISRAGGRTPEERRSAAGEPRTSHMCTSPAPEPIELPRAILRRWTVIHSGIWSRWGATDAPPRAPRAS